MRLPPHVLHKAGFVILALAVCTYFGFEFELFAEETSVSLERERDDLNRLMLVSATVMALLLAFGWSRLRHSIVERDGRVTAERRAHDAARHDALTGLPNRRLFQERAGEMLAAAWDEGSKCAVFFVDLDGFKPVNDVHGHPAGDAVLVEVARRLTRSAPREACVARLGGDEFAVVVAGLSGSDSAALIARRMLKEFEAPFAVVDTDVHVGATVGVAVGPDHGRRTEDLIAAADHAMYEGKRNRRRQVRVYRVA
jgi:diguanylate cyclase